MGILAKLREINVGTRAGAVKPGTSNAALDEFIHSGVKFTASHPRIEDVYYRAVQALMDCVVPSPNGGRMLIEGHVYIGCWLESTGTVSTDILSRFCPDTARQVFELFADYQREDGLIPYKIVDSGGMFRQVQMVTPFARCVWNYYTRHQDKKFLEKMYHAVCRNDQWLSVYRNTRGTGCVEAFCTFDTGNDASPRFWHVTDTPYKGDPAQYDPASPILPFLAPDMTANVYCQRKYMQKMADELGLDEGLWTKKAEETLESLMKYCYDPRDHYFYDRDNLDRFVRVQTDNMMRVMADEVGDDAMFEDALRRYLLNTRKHLSRYPLTPFAMDNPGFFQEFNFNSWTGKISFLTDTRLLSAFDYHRRHVELSWILHPIITAMSRSERFAGSLSPWIGCEGKSSNFSPTMLCVLDYLERYCGIYPTTEAELWFTSLIPRGIDYGDVVAEETGYARTVDGIDFEFINEKEQSSIYKNGKLLYTFPYGIRLVTERSGELKEVIGMTVQRTQGTIRYGEQVLPFAVSGNERLAYRGGGFVSVENPGVVPFNYGEYDAITL